MSRLSHTCYRLNPCDPPWPGHTNISWRHKGAVATVSVACGVPGFQCSATAGSQNIVFFLLQFGLKTTFRGKCESNVCILPFVIGTEDDVSEKNVKLTSVSFLFEFVLKTTFRSKNGANVCVLPF
jgi:hypothetical protein